MDLPAPIRVVAFGGPNYSKIPFQGLEKVEEGFFGLMYCSCPDPVFIQPSH